MQKRRVAFVNRDELVLDHFLRRNLPLFL